MKDKNEAGVRATIEQLIEAGTSSDLSELDNIYHADMNIIMLDHESGEINRFNKPSFISMLENMMTDQNPIDNQWAKFHTTDVEENRGHVLITRKVPIGGQCKELTLSIDLIHESNRWQVTREIIHVRPDN